MPTEYVITEERMTGFADQARRLGGVEDGLTVAQMQEIFEGVTPGSDLPDAEDASFGTVTEYSSEVVTASKTYQTNTRGYKFTVNETFTFEGFRYNHYMAVWGTCWFNLWDAETEEALATASVNFYDTYGSQNAEGYHDVLIETPFNLETGKTYMVSVYYSEYITVQKLENAEISINPKITINGYYASSNNAYPSTEQTGYMVDLALVMATVAQPEYKIQGDTLTAIADEARRISGASGTVSPSHIQETMESVILQEKTVTPTDTEQEIIPDDGYYGLSKVLVSAAESDSGRTDGLTFSSKVSEVTIEYETGSAAAIFNINPVETMQSSANGQVTS